MIRINLAPFFLFILLGSINAKLISGIDTLYTAAFDFTRQNTTDDSSDLRITHVDPGGDHFTGYNKESIIKLDTNFDDITMAPDSGYSNWATACVGCVYCLITREGYYAKFEVSFYITTHVQFYIINWVYQDDGTKNLSETPIYNNKNIKTNWGLIKAEFR